MFDHANVDHVSEGVATHEKYDKMCNLLRRIIKQNGIQVASPEAPNVDKRDRHGDQN